jgi:muramidase (phage lysozyme)
LQKQSFAENPKQDPKAENPQSSASGLYQIIDSTWREFQQTANQVYHPQPPWNYSRAKDAPPEVQHRVAMLIPVSRWAMEGAASGGVIARNSSNWR